jgi:hypothetical protein
MARFAELQSVSLEGLIVEIFEEAGHRLAKIVLTAPVVVDLSGPEMADAHLGDRVIVRASIEGIGGPKEDV